jgi:hypothetical protein
VFVVHEILIGLEWQGWIMGDQTPRAPLHRVKKNTLIVRVYTFFSSSSYSLHHPSIENKAIAIAKNKNPPPPPSCDLCTFKPIGYGERSLERPQCSTSSVGLVHYEPQRKEVEGASFIFFLAQPSPKR